MKISLNWAQRYSNVDLKKQSPDELVKLATERLGGVEGYLELGEHYKNIYVAKVVSFIKHPNADKLRVCKLDDGGMAKGVNRDDNGYVQVVCGAPELKEGWIVAWLAPGASVPSSYEGEVFELAAKELRGEVSYGMLGTPKELAISGDDSQLLVISEDEFLNKKLQLGTLFSDYLELDDIILEIENKMFTHRPDCFGVLGVARELAGIQDLAFTSPDWYIQDPKFEVVKDKLPAKLINDAAELAPRVMMVPLEGITLQDSPYWMQSYLTRVGIRPINNIVDITNYVMNLTGQPMHAFDYNKLQAHSKDGVALGPRMAKEGEEIVLLGGKKVTLTKDDVVLATDKIAVDIAGIMGGEDTEVDKHTKAILLTCCSFDMYTVRRMSMRHGVFTDAATRNTKGQPPAQIDRVLAYAMKLMGEYADAKQAGLVQDDFKKREHFARHNYIELSSKFINERLGSKLTDKEIVKILNNVELAAHEASGLISVTPPFWRTDIEIPEDIVEEVGRLYGFNRLPLKLPKRDITPAQPNSLLELKRQLRERLARAGANELLNYSFVHGDLLKKVGQDAQHAFKIRNALSPDLQYYRLSILPSLLDKVHSNIKAGFDKLALFELGKVHYKGEMDVNEPDVPNEDNHLGFVIAFDDKSSPAGAPYYQARQYLEWIAPELVKSLVPLHDFDLKNDEWGQQLIALYEPARSAVVVKDGQIWGVIGEFKTSVQKALKLPLAAAGFEVHLDVLSLKETTYTPLSKYPSTEQDITLKVPESVSFIELADCLVTELSKSDYLYALQPKSAYQKETENNKNITFGITLSHQSRTLQKIEVNKLVEQLAQQAQRELDAEIV